MDAAGDPDLKLQKKSADLLSEFETSLSRCLWRTDVSPARTPRARRAVDSRQVKRLVGLLEPFQEWPQLLDPRLAALLPPVIDAFVETLGFVDQGPELSRRGHAASTAKVVPLRFAICRILYTLCKIRGHKVISRFFSHEPRHFEPIVLAFRRWDARSATDGETSDPWDAPLTWEERYIILLWLSHLLLVPFDIASISSAGVSTDPDGLQGDLEMPKGLPWGARYLTLLGLKYIGSASKEREAAQSLLVRLSIRPDLRKAGLMDRLVHWAVSSLKSDSQPDRPRSIYHHVGLLSYLTGFLRAADHDVALGFVSQIYQIAQMIVSGESRFHEDIRSSALTRKAVTKQYQTLACLLLRPSPLPSTRPSRAPLPELLEDVIEYLLTALADKDTPVRYAASKAIGAITVRLDRLLAQDVVQAILESLGEDLVWTSVLTDRKVVETDVRLLGRTSETMDFAAVNALRWHGLILTLASLLFYRSPPPDQLPEILEYLVLALQFEQRSSTRSSVGTNVRDAACFGIWALSRKYSTAELLAVDVTSIRAARCYGASISVLQILATELVVAACLDPIGNIRRGASAALQELIGRHPDTVSAGIPLVLVVDYHAVALRSRAITEVAASASEVDRIYWNALVGGLLGWRGIRSSDADSRRAASAAVGVISQVEDRGYTQADAIVDALLADMSRLQDRQVEEKHGMVLSISALLDAVYSSLSSGPPERQVSSAILYSGIFRKAQSAMDMVTERDFKSSLRPELIAEAACYLVSSNARLVKLVSEKYTEPHSSTVPDLTSTVTRSIAILTLAFAKSNEEVLEASNKAAQMLFRILDKQTQSSLVQRWLPRVQLDHSGILRASGQEIPYLHALGAVFPSYATTDKRSSGRPLDEEQLEIVRAILANTRAPVAIETRVAALRSLTNGVFAYNVFNSELVDSLGSCLDDYTIDSRGDIGSLVRLEAIDAVCAILKNVFAPDISQRTLVQQMLSRVVRLSAEKMDKVRLRAATCLHQAWARSHPSLAQNLLVADSGQTSSYPYFQGLLRIVESEEVSWAHRSLLEGYLTSAGAGSPSVLEASRRALADFVEETAGNVDSHAFSLGTLCGYILAILRDNQNHDRVIVPALEVAAFLLNLGLADLMNHDDFNWNSLFTTVQKLHFQSGNVHKLEAAVKVYSGLAWISAVRTPVLAKMVRMLLHPFASVRTAVAESLFTYFELQRDQDDRADDVQRFLVSTDWSLPTAQLKHRAGQVSKCCFPVDEK